MTRCAMRWLALLCLPALLAGCQAVDVEERALVVVMGVDELEGGIIQICVKIPTTNKSGTSAGSSASGGQSGGSEQPGQEKDKEVAKKLGVTNIAAAGYLVLVSRGVDWEHAISQLHAATPRTLLFSQVREIVFSQQAASGDSFLSLLQNVYSLQSLHAMAALVISTSTAVELVCEQQSYLGARLSKYIDVTIRDYASKGYVPSTTISEMRRAMLSPLRDPLLILGAVNEFKALDSPEGGEPVNVDAGDMSRASQNPVELVGAAVTDGTRVRGTLTGFETQLTHLVLDQMDNLIIEDGQRYAIVDKIGTSSATYRDGVLTLRVRVRITPGFLSSDVDASREQAAKTLQAELEKLISRLQSMDSDALGFGASVMFGCATMEDWEKKDWATAYREARTDVQVIYQ